MDAGSRRDGSGEEYAQAFSLEPAYLSPANTPFIMPDSTSIDYQHCLYTKEKLPPSNIYCFSYIFQMKNTCSTQTLKPLGWKKVTLIFLLANIYF